jgi:ABC-type multidrug transport system fused ATPase/permease subunit
MAAGTLTCAILSTVMVICAAICIRTFNCCRSHWFDNRATGDLMARVIEDVNSVERVLIDGIEQGVVAVLQIVILLAVMFYLNATLALLALVPFPLLIAGALTYTLTAHCRYRLQRRASGHECASARQSFRGSSDQKLRPRTQRFSRMS